MKPLRRPLFRSIATASMLCFHLLAVTHPYAATVNWTAGSGDWSTGGNWDPSAVPLAEDDVVFPFATPIPTINTITLGAGSVANSLRMQGDYLFTGGSLGLTTGGIYINRGHMLRLDSQLTGGGGLNLTGGGALRLGNSTNNYTGLTTVANGTLIISDPAQLGADSSAVVVTGSATRGLGGGSLLLDGSAGSIVFTRDLSLQGYGPITDRSAAMSSIGSNTVTGNIEFSAGNVATAINSTSGMLSLSGDLTALGAGQLRFGVVNSTGTGSYHVTGRLTGNMNIDKQGAGTLILDPSNASSFSGLVLASSGSVRIYDGASAGTSTANGALTLGGGSGTLELRTNTPDSFASRRMHMSTSGNGVLFLDHGLNSNLVNQTVRLSALTLTAGSTTRTLTINSRNGYGVSFTGNSVGGSLAGNNNITVNANGLVSFVGDFWNNTNTTARTLTMTVNTGANAVITGNLNATGAAHILTKGGAGTLSIRGENSTYSGATNINAGTLSITHIGSINDNSAAVNMGSGTGAGTLNVVGENLIASQTAVNKAFNLAGTTGGGLILANQTGSSPGLVINGGFTAGGAGTKALTLGGTNLQENEIRGAIANNSASNVTSLYKTGSNTWVLSGANTYTGSTLLNNGVLKIQDTFSGTSTNVLADNALIGLGFSSGVITEGTAGGLFHYAGADGAMSEESIGNLLTISGAGTIRVTAGEGGTAVLNIASMNELPVTTLNTTVAIGTTSTATVSVASTAGLVPGMRVLGGSSTAFIVSITNGTQMVLSSNQASLLVGRELTFERVPGSSTVNFAPDFASTITLGGVTTAGFLNGYSYFNGADFAFAPTVGTSTLRAPIYFGPEADAGFVLASDALVADSHNVVAGVDTSNGAITVRSLKILGETGSSRVVNATALMTIRAGGDGVGGNGTSGGILVTDGSATITGTGGITTGSTGGELVIRVNKDTDILYLDTPVTSATTKGLTKTGEGTLVISKLNAHTTGGATNLLEGKIQLAPGGRLSANTVNLLMRQGTEFDLNGISVAQTATSSSVGQLMGTGVVTNTSPDPVVFATAGSGGTFNGTINEVAGQISYVKMGTTASQTFNGIHNYTGSTTIGVPGSGTTGFLFVSSLANIGEPSGLGRGDATDTASNAASLIFGGTTGGLAYTGPVSVVTDRLFTMSGTAATAGAGITNNGLNNASLVFSNTNPIAFGSTANQDLRLGGSSISDNWFYPQINDNVDAGAITRLTKINAGLWILGNENNSYSGPTTITDGVVQAQDGSTLPNASGLILGNTTSTTAVFQSSGNFTRDLATVANAGANTVSWATGTSTGGGGFAASTEKLVVAIGGLDSPTTLVWGGADGFLPTGTTSGTNLGSRLILGSTTSLAEVDFRNPIDLNGGNRVITVNDNTSTFTDIATISGAISGAAGITKNGNGVLQLFGENTYTGVTSYTAGTLVVKSLGNSDSPGASSLGDTTTADTAGSALTLGNGSTGGATLQYIGQGEISDRMIRLNSTTGSTLIHADGSGPLILTNVVNDMAAGAKILYLRGSNSLGNMVTSDLGDNGGNLSLIVDGGATWILSGNNTYSGNTTMSAGSLGIGGDSVLGNGTLILSSGSMFAYGADRTITNAVSQNNNTGPAFIGDYSLTFTSDLALLATTSNPSTTANNISAPGKTVTLAGDVTANAITAARTWTLLGAGTTFINGDITSTTAFGLNITYTGNGVLNLGGANTTFNTAAATGANTIINNNAGTINLIDDGLLSPGNVTVNAGLLDIKGNLDQVVANLTMGASTATYSELRIGADRTLTINGNITYGASNAATANPDPAVISGPGTMHLGATETIVTIADNLSAEIDMSWEMARLTGSGTLTKAGNGTLDIRGITNNDFTGIYQVNAGAILGLGAFDSNILLNGGVFEGNGDFDRNIGTGDNEVQWAAGSAGGGFSAFGGLHTIELNGGAALVWGGTGGTAFFAEETAPLIFGSATADSVVDFTNDLDLNGGPRTVTVVDNTTLLGDRADLSGIISNGSLVKTGNGFLRLTGDNTFAGGVTVTSGSLQFATVSDNGGAASNLGQGSDGITLSGGRLQFVGNTDQSTNRAITLTTTGILDASGTDDATITFAGGITAAGFTQILDGTGFGILSGQVTQTGTAADLTKQGTGTWRIDNAQTIADDIFVNDGLLILNVAEAFTADDIFIRSGTLRLGVNAALSRTTDDVQISGETSSGGVFDIYGTTGSAPTDIIIGRNAANPSALPILTGSLVDSIGGGSINPSTLNVRSGTVSADVVASSTVTLGGTVSGDNGGIYSSDGHITGNVTLNGALNLFSGTISGNLLFNNNNAVAKHSPNTVTLSGSNNVANAGVTTVNNGTLRLDFSANTDTKIGSDGLSMFGGNLQIDGHATTPVTVNAGPMILGSTSDPAPSVVTINAAGGAATLQVGTITRNLGATLRFNRSSTDAHLTTTATNAAGDILGGWATYRLAGGDTLFATVSGGEITGFASTVINDIGAWTEGADVTESTGFTGSLAGSLSINSLRFDAAAGSGITVGANDVLNIASGGILITDNVASGNVSITGGRITGGVNELIVTHDGAASFTLGSQLTGTQAITKAGTGLMVLDSATNTANGTLRLSGGTVRLQGGGALGDRAAVILEPVEGVVLDVANSESIGSISGGSSANYKGMVIKIADDQTLTFNQTASLTYWGNIQAASGAATLTKTGASQLTIADGSVDLGAGGVLNIIGGRLALDMNGNNNQITQLASGMTVNIRDGGSLFVEHNDITLISGQGRISNNVGINFSSGGSTTDSFFLRHNQNDDYIEIIGGVKFASGVSSIRLDATSTGTSALTVLRAASVVRENQATFVLRGINTHKTSSGSSQFQSTAVFSPFGAGTGTSLPVVPWAIGSSTGGTDAADSFLTTTGAANNPWRPLNLSTEYAIASDTAGWGAVNANNNVLVNATTADAASQTVRSLLIATGDGAVDLTGDGSGLLTVQSGGFLFSGTGTSTLGGFNGIAISATAGEYVFHVMGSSATVASPLTTSGAKVTKSGPGVLILSANNAGIGDVAINEGVLQLTDLDNIGGNTGNLILAGGTLRLDAEAYSGDDFSTRTVTLISGNSTLDTNGLDLTLANSIGNGGAGSLTKTGVGILTLNAQANYSGGTSITNGTLRFGTANALPTTTEVTFTGTTAVLDIGEHSSTIGSLVLNSSSNGTLNIAPDATLTVNGTILNGNATTSLRVNGGGTAIIQGDVMLTPTTSSRTLQLFVNDDGNVIFNGSITNAASTASAFAKYGNGTLDITQPSFYTGATTIGNSSNAGGTVNVTGNGTLSTGNLTVSNGILNLHHNAPLQTVATLAMGGGPAGASAQIDIGAGVTLRPTAISFSSTNSNLTAVISGEGTLDLGTTGILVTINNSGAVDIDMSWEMDTVIGSGIFTKAGAGTLDIRGVENYNFTGSYQINAGAILGLGLDEGDNLILNGGVFEGNGSFTRSLGTGANQVQWAAGTAGGGFAASGGNLTVTLAGAPDPLVWGGTEFFVPAGAPLIFGSTTADSVVNFTHNIDLNGGNRTINAINNLTLVEGVVVDTDKALLSGNLTNGSITKTGNGVLVLGGNNTFTAPIVINGSGGTLEFSSLANLGGSDTSISLQAGFFSFGGSTDLTVPNPINIDPGTAGQSISLQNLAANGTNGAVVTFSGPITTGANILTLAGSGAGIITGGITQTGTAADVYVTSGNWTLRGSNVIGDDIVVQGPTAVLNLDGTGIITHNTTTSSGLYGRNGAVINLLALNPFVEPGGLDFIFLGDTGGVLPGTLNMNGFDLTTPRLDLGQVGADLSGIILGTATLTVNTTLNLYRGSIEAGLASGVTAAKNGQGEVVLSGDNSGLTGATNVINGTLRLDYSNDNNRKIGSGNLNMYGGTLIVDGSDTATTSQSVSLLNVGGGVGANTGASTIEINNGTGQLADLSFGAITRTTVGGTVNFNLASANASVITTASNPANLTSLGGWATVSNTAFATIDEGKIIALTSTAKDDVSTWLAGDNVTDASGYTGSLGSSSVNSIIFNAVSGSALVIGEGERFTVSSGGILVTENSGAGSISGGVITSALPIGSSQVLTELIVHQHSANDFTLTSTLNGSLALTKSGTGTLIVNGNNIYTDQTSINEGTLSVFGGNAIGDRSVVNVKNRPDAFLELNNGTETISGLTGGGVDGGVVRIGTGTLHLLNNSGSTRTFIGRLEGSGTLIKNGANSQEFEGNSTGFTGTVIINRGLLHLDSGSGAMTAVSNFIVNGGELLTDQEQSGSRDRIGNAAVVTLNNTATTRGLWLRNENQNANRADTIGTVLLGSGHNVIQATNNGGSGGSSNVGTMSVTNWLRENQATAILRGQNLGGASGTRGRITTGAMPAGAVGGAGVADSATLTIVPYFIGAAGLLGSSTDAEVLASLGNSFVTWVSSGEGFRPLNLTSEYTLNAAGYNGLSGVTMDNVRIAANPGAALTGGSKTINSLVIDSSAEAVTLTGGESDILTLASGALLATTTTPANAMVMDGFSELRTATGEYLLYVTNATSTLAISSSLTSDALLTKAGAGTLILSGVNTFTGGTWFNQGLIEVSGLDALGSGGLNFHGGGLRWASGSTFDPTGRSVTFGTGGAVFDTNGNDVTFANVFGGGGEGGLTKVGNGVLTLNAAGNFAGPVSINLGTVVYGVANALPSGTNLTLAGGTLDIGAFDTTLGSLDFTVSSTITGSANLTFTGDVNQSTGSRTLTVTNTGITTFDGNLLSITNASTTARTIGLAPGTGATLVINSQIVDGSGAGSVNKTGAGTLVLNAVNFYTGTTTLNGGTTFIGHGSSLGAATGTLALTSGTLSGDGNGEKVIARNVTHGGTFVLDGDDKLTFQGTWLNNAASRTLTVNGAGGAELAGQVNLSEHATTARTLTVNGDGNVLISGVVSNGTGTGNSALTYSGTGVLSLSNANTYSGNTNVNGGALLANNTTGSATGTGNVTVAVAGTLGGMGSISGAVTLNGMLSPGSVDLAGISTAGQLTVGTIVANTNSELFLQVGGATVVDPAAIAAYQANPGTFTVPDSWTSSYLAGNTSHDQLNITSTDAVTLNTTVTISGTYLGDYTPSFGDVFHFVDWASLGTTSLGGTQEFVNLPFIPGGGTWNTDFFSSHGIVFVVPEPSRMLLLFVGLMGLCFRRRRH
ncbi:autotransporter-associated beta strand repeat-containing protein [Prosthecobacter sp. SYSU 5D2]|uniref:autotransporter-associated beta strand repeat-containing protein n=1 Tax=Prosthecobacter sp. SYSU 5D2 TaxID=3134134 RepID=UPI0031FE5AD3